MKRAEFELLMHEFRTTRDNTREWYHTRWERIIDEYSLSGFDGLVDYMMENINLAEKMVTHDATLGKMHVVIRKMLTLSSVRYPEFSIKERNPKDEPIAHVLGDVFPIEIERVNWYSKMRTRNLWALCTGFGAIKLGVNSVFHYDQPALAGNLPKSLEDRDWWNLGPYGATTEWADPSITPGDVNMIHIPSTNVLSHPYNAPTLQHVIRWYIKFPRPLLDIYHDTRFGPDRVNVQSIKEDGDIEDPYFNNLPWDARIHSLRGEVIWCYDVASRKYCVLAEGCNSCLMDWTPVNRNIEPLHIFTPIESVRSWRGIPYAHRMLNQATAINEMRILLKGKIARDGKQIFLYDPGECSPEQVTQINHLPDGHWHPFPGLASLIKDGKEFIKAIEFGKPSADMMRLMSMFDGDFREMSGLDNPTMNMVNTKSQSATETQVRAQQTHVDIEDYVQTNEESQKTVARDYLKLICAEWPIEKLVRVSGFNEYSYFWIPVTRDMVQSDFSLEIVVGSTQKLDKAMYNRQWAEVLPRLMELGAKKQQQLMAQMQGMPTDGLNYDEMIRVTVDQFDPTIARRILQRRDPIMLMFRILQTYGVAPTGNGDISPDIVRELQRRITMGMQNPFGQQTPLQAEGQPAGMPGSTPSFEERTGTPKPSNGQMQPMGMQMQNMSGFMPGRMTSEMAGV